MALYKDGNPVSGLNSIPRLTLAQYNALNVKPEFWVRTDAPESYKKLSADQVSYDSNTSVKEKIDELAGSATTLLSQQQLTLTDTSYLLSDQVSKYRFIVFAISWVGGMFSNYLFTLGGAIKNCRLYLNAISTSEYADIVEFTDDTHITLKTTNTNVYISVFGIK